MRIPGEEVASRRGELGLSQSELASDAGVTSRTISALETGATWPRASTRSRIEQALLWKVGSLSSIRNGGSSSELSAKEIDELPPEIRRRAANRFAHGTAAKSPVEAPLASHSEAEVEFSPDNPETVFLLNSLSLLEANVTLLDTLPEEFADTIRASTVAFLPRIMDTLDEQDRFEVAKFALSLWSKSQGEHDG